MKPLSLKMIVEIMNGTIIQGMDDLFIHEIETRWKRFKPNTLFFDFYHGPSLPLNRDPKNFPYAIVTYRPDSFTGPSENVTIIRVADIEEAYWKFIDFYRNLFSIPVIGVTGTCGKTTTKEMVKHILSKTYQVSATYKSYNASFRNLGYLLEMNDDTQAAVFEMGVAFAGDLITSCRYFKPRVGIITNIGIDHLQAFGTLDAYIKAKAEILEGLDYQGTLILNADDENIQKIDLHKFRGKILYFGHSDSSHYKILKIIPEDGILQCTFQYQEKIYHFSVPGHGAFYAYNAVAAIAAAHSVGLEIGEAGQRLASFQNVERHFEIKEGIQGSTIIDDTWSTNPTSVEAALKLLQSLSHGKMTIAVLGKMSLLGSQSGKYHYQTGAKVAELGIDRLIVIGPGADEIWRGAIENGMESNDVYFCKDSDETYEVLQKLLEITSLVLVKTSMLSSYKDLMDKIIVKNEQEE
ncbi:MAG TPA: Mur ligase family protein [Bacillota bacterium]|nr:Mur ligase family protein [Bacillota bacterium]